MEDLDRENFYYPLKKCKTLKEILKLIDNIDDDDLQRIIMDKYNQYLEYNKQNNIDISVLIVTLEATYLDFIKNNHQKINYRIIQKVLQKELIMEILKKHILNLTVILLWMKAKLEYNQIIKIVETSNFIVLKLGDSSAILVHKKGFTKGTLEEFISFINDKVEKRL